VNVRVFRVVVRGHFDGLTEDQRRALLAESDDHDYLRSAFTADGTFTYDRRLVAFNLRYEVRVDEEGDDPVAVGLDHARSDLASWGLRAKHLRATAVDMADVWSRDATEDEATSSPAPIAEP